MGSHAISDVSGVCCEDEAHIRREKLEHVPELAFHILLVASAGIFSQRVSVGPFCLGAGSSSRWRIPRGNFMDIQQRRVESCVALHLIGGLGRCSRAA